MCARTNRHCLTLGGALSVGAGQRNDALVDLDAGHDAQRVEDLHEAAPVRQPADSTGNFYISHSINVETDCTETFLSS